MKNAISLKFVSVLILTNVIENYNGTTVSSSGLGYDSMVIVIKVHNILDGREMSKVVRKVPLDGIGTQI